MRIESPLQIVYWQVSKLVRYTRNPRKNDAVVDRICGSIREYGFVVPILAKADGTVIDGDLRLKGAIKEGMAEVPVIVCDGWSESQVKAFRLLVNRSVTWAAWDPELLALELQELAATDFNLDLTGFDPRELDDALAAAELDEQVDEVPPLPEKAVSRPGDLWLCGTGRSQHRVLCGDATSPEAVARLLVDRKPILLVSDPPYGISLDSFCGEMVEIGGAVIHHLLVGQREAPLGQAVTAWFVWRASFRAKYHGLKGLLTLIWSIGNCAERNIRPL